MAVWVSELAVRTAVKVLKGVAVRKVDGRGVRVHVAKAWYGVRVRVGVRVMVGVRDTVGVVVMVAVGVTVIVGVDVIVAVGVGVGIPAVASNSPE